MFIGIWLLALAVTGLQFYRSSVEREQIAPSVRMHVVYADEMILGDVRNQRPVVSIHLENRGSEDTATTNLEIYSNGGTFGLHAFTMLLDAEGEPIRHEGHGEPLPGSSSRHYYIDASVIQGDEIMVIAEFAHGPQIALHAQMNCFGNRKELSESQQRKLHRSWAKTKARTGRGA